MRLPDGLRLHDAKSLTPEKALELYQRDQLLWLQLNNADVQCCKRFGPTKLVDQYAESQSVFRRRWSVENSMKYDRQELEPDCVLGSKDLPADAFYVSAILQKDESCLTRFFADVPFATPPLLAKTIHDDGVWLL